MSGRAGTRYVAAPVGEASHPASGRFSLDGTGRFGDGNSGSDSAAEARGCVKIIFGETDFMGDEGTKRAAQEYLAAKLSKEGQSYEDGLNRETAEKARSRGLEKSSGHGDCEV